jgi:hypothetical protein
MSPWRYLDRIASATVPLRTVVERVTGLVGLDLAHINASALDQGIRGYLWTRGSGKDILDPLLDAHDSYVRQHDFGLEFRKKGDASAGTIATPMFVRQGDVRYKVPITQDTDLPRYLSFSFSDVDADHQTNAVIAQRTADAVDTTRDVTINMTTLVLHVDEAKQLADRWFRRQWFESTGVENAFTMRELALEPGDVWTLDLDGNRATYRLTSTLIGADGVMPCKWVRDDPSLAELSGASGAAMDGRADSVITVGVIAKGFVLDIPLITDADNSVNPLLYYGAGPHAAGSLAGCHDLRSGGRRIFDPVRDRRVVAGADMGLYDRSARLRQSLAVGPRQQRQRGAEERDDPVDDRGRLRRHAQRQPGDDRRRDDPVRDRDLGTRRQLHLVRPEARASRHRMGGRHACRWGSIRPARPGR